MAPTIPGASCSELRGALADSTGDTPAMRRSTDGILVSHAGSLPRPDELIELNRVRQEGEDPGFDEEGFQTELTAAVRDVVAKQVAAGVTVPGDGEYGKSMGHKVNYGAWWSYSFSRLSGLDPNGPGSTTCRQCDRRRRRPAHELR